MSASTLSMDARKRTSRVNSSDQIANMLNPARTSERKSTINHSLINRQNLRAQQVKVRMEKEDRDLKAREEPFKMNRFKNIESKITRDGSRRGSMNSTSSSSAARTSQQTRYEQDEEESIYNNHDDQPEYDNGSYSYDNQSMADQEYQRSSRDYAPQEYEKENLSSNFNATPRNATPSGSISKHENYGKIPAYLQQHKEELAAKKAEKERVEKEKALGIPDGMILMPEEQRLQTLTILQENHTKLMNEIARFPLRVETLARQKAKAELEAKLEEVEKAITLFSRKRVLVKPE